MPHRAHDGLAEATAVRPAQEPTPQRWQGPCAVGKSQRETLTRAGSPAVTADPCLFLLLRDECLLDTLDIIPCGAISNAKLAMLRHKKPPTGHTTAGGG